MSSKTHTFIDSKLSPLGAIDLLAPNFYKKQNDPDFFNYNAIKLQILKLELKIIIRKVSKITGISYDEMIRKSRKPEYVYARQLSMFITRLFTKYSLSFIGEQFGGKDHATVIHSTKTILNWYDTDSNKRIKIDSIITCLNRIAKTKKTVDYLR